MQHRLETIELRRPILQQVPVSGHDVVCLRLGVGGARRRPRRRVHLGRVLARASGPTQTPKHPHRFVSTAATMMVKGTAAAHNNSDWHRDNYDLYAVSDY